MKVGDSVRFLNETGEGVITRFINKTTVGVTIEQGFELPFLISQLVIIPNYLETKETTSAQKSEVIVPIDRLNVEQKSGDRGIYLAISPEKIKDISNSDFNLWLINQTDYIITLSLSIIKPEGIKTLNIFSINAFQQALVETINKEKWNDFNNLKFDILFHNDKLHQHHSPISEIIKLKTVKLYKENTFIENDFLLEKSFIIPIWDMNFKEIKTTQEIKTANTIDFSKFLFQKETGISRSKKSKPHNNKSELEIDLHTEELLDDYKGMNNGQIVQVQLNYFQRKLNIAIENNYKRLIVIHGIGNGRLKQEIRTILTSYNMQYFDASYAKYGFGATEVVIS